MRICIFTLFTLVAVTGNLVAQRLNSLSVQGVTPLTPYGSTTPTNNIITARGLAEIVYPSSADFSNVNVAFGAGSTSSVSCYDYSVTPAVSMATPTNWSNSAASPFIVRVTGGGAISTDWAEYNVKLKKLIASSLPMTITTGSANFAESWTPSTIG